MPKVVKVKTATMYGRFGVTTLDIYQDLERVRGSVVIKGTRLGTSDVLRVFLSGVSIEELRMYFATRPLTRDEVECALRWAMKHPTLRNRKR